MTNTSILNKIDFEPVLKPGQFVRIEPLDKYGFYVFPRQQAVEVLPPVTVNVATPYTTQLAAFSDTGSQTPIEKEVTELDMPRFNLAQYRLVAIDDVLFQIKQPAAIARYVNRDGPVHFGKSDTVEFYKSGMWSMLPELFVYQDDTRPTVVATNTTYEATYYARFKAFGFRYVLEKVSSAQAADNPALTLRVEGQ